jgi:hypothetical protein
VERTGGLGSRVGTDAAGEGELLEEVTHPALFLGDVGVDLGVDALEVGLGENSGRAVAWRCQMRMQPYSYGSTHRDPR